MEVDVPRSTWVKAVLEPLGTERYIWIELPLPPLPAGHRWETVLEHLQLAERRNQEGSDADVLIRCYDALGALAPTDPKAIIPADINAEKRAVLDKALLEFRDFLQRGRHPQKTGDARGRYDTDHRDSEFALAMTKVWLTTSRGSRQGLGSRAAFTRQPRVRFWGHRRLSLKPTFRMFRGILNRQGSCQHDGDER